MSNKPNRRYQVEIRMGADDLRAVIKALESIVFDLEARKAEDEPLDMVSGGWDSGYYLSAKVDTGITGDSYREALAAYMADPARHHKDEVKSF